MKTRNLKAKTLSILLTIVMLLGMLPMSVFAADAEDYITVFNKRVNAGQYFAGGSGVVSDDAPADNYLYYEGDGRIALNSFVYTDTDVYHAILTDHKDFSITLIGESELTNGSGNTSVAVNNGKLQISGDGSLKSNGRIICSGFELSGGTVTADGVTSDGDISITGGELTLTEWSLKAIGDHDISISRGKLTVSGHMYAIYATGDNGTVSITGGEVELTARDSGYGDDKAIFAGTITIGENMKILAGSSAADAAAVDAYNDQMYVKITPKAPDLTITGGTEGTDYTYENGVLDIKNAGTYEIKNADNVTVTGDIIKVSALSGTVNITLSGVVINVSGTGNNGTNALAAFEITGECTTNLILKDGCENVFDSGYNRAGIANHSHPLTIACEHSESAAHKCSTNCGNLRAVGQCDGAGIGGDAFEHGANITIKGGNIVADIVDQNGGAGIGGGDGGNGSNITITGGTVTATGGDGAGIGGGFYGNGSNITITDGTVKAKGGMGAGIGGGSHGDGDNITISGGEIIAGDLEAGGAGIGGGFFGNSSNITITGGNVVALSNDAGIKGDNITITGGEVLANTVKGIGGIYGNNIKIAPAENTIIYAYNGSRTENTPLDGSPFTSETDIRNLIDGNSSFYCYAEHVHSFSTDWTYDEDSHWHAPTCGHDDAAVKVSHSYGTEWKSDSTSHWHECICGAKNEEAAHSYGTEWKSDGTNHWRECSCGAKSDEAAHSGGTATCTEKAKCTVCAVEYGNLAEHTYGSEWKSDGTNHWHECTCGAKSDEAAHNGGTATCTVKAKCDVCGTEYGNLAEHTYGSEWKSDGTNHWHECICGAKTEEAAHSGGTATCTEKAKCTVCAVEYGDLAEHTYGTEWKSDGTNHWHECTCGAKSGEAAHNGGTATCTEKAKCTVCAVEYGNLAEHTYGTEWKSDGTNHWHECTCGAKTEEAAHSGGTATCTEKAKCTVCAVEYGNLAEHTYGTGWKSDSTNHWHECTCGAKTGEAAHNGGTATCTEKAKCTVCAVEYGNLAEHTYGTEWKSDGTNHWHECTCDAKSGEAAHSGGTATCTEKAKCTVCAVEYGNLAEHTYGTEWKSDSTNHWHECTCGAKSGEAAHNGGTATCKDKAKCTVCAVEYGNLAEHTYGSEWKSDGTNHWHECTCGAKSEEAAHNGGTATCKDKAVCSVCTATYGELANHTYKDGKCTVCESADPNYVPETDSPQTGDNSHMALWFALLFISGGAVITLTVVDRKRKTANR